MESVSSERVSKPSNLWRKKVRRFWILFQDEKRSIYVHVS